MNRLEALLESVKHALPGQHTLNRQGRISPFIKEKVGNIVPGKDSKDLYRMHEIFPEVFKEKTSFMGEHHSNFHGISNPNHDRWLEANMLFYKEGEFDEEGNFHTPIAIYDTGTSGYLLFQLGNYQLVEPYQSKQLEQGRIKIFTGLRNKKEYFHQSIDDKYREDYFTEVASNFLSHSFVLAHNRSASRMETNHVDYRTINDFYKEANIRHILRYNQSFTTAEDVSSGKFGPNYVSMTTPIDNIRIFSQWCGENEVYLINPDKVSDIMFESKSDITHTS